MNRNEAITGLAEYALDKELIRPGRKNMGSEQPVGCIENRYLFTRRSAGK